MTMPVTRSALGVGGRQRQVRGAGTVVDVYGRADQHHTRAAIGARLTVMKPVAQPEAGGHVGYEERADAVEERRVEPRADEPRLRRVRRARRTAAAASVQRAIRFERCDMAILRGPLRGDAARKIRTKFGRKFQPLEFKRLIPESRFGPSGHRRFSCKVSPTSLAQRAVCHASDGFGYFHLRWIHSQSAGLDRISASSART